MCWGRTWKHCRERSLGAQFSCGWTVKWGWGAEGEMEAPERSPRGYQALYMLLLGFSLFCHPS